MPIYEFYCGDCHTVFSFLARSAGSSRRPACPRCHRPDLERRASAFAISKGRPEPSGEEEGPAGLDDSRMERVMAELAEEAEGLDESNPRQMARMMRKLYRSTGLPLGEGMEEAIRRMEAGEDPDKIEEEMGDLLEGEEVSLEKGAERVRALRRKLAAPRIDDTLYEL
jgi:putative FmdB family regulatory protein